MAMLDLTHHEIAALKLAAGREQQVFTAWGAALGAVVERLQGCGLVSEGPVVTITEAGLCALAAAERDQALAREEQLREALTPSADTKAAYMGEFRMGVRLRDPNSGEEEHMSVDVPWTTIKEIMAAIRDYAEQKA